MDEAEVDRRVRTILAEILSDIPDVMTVDADADLFHNVALNSFTVMGLLVKLEDEFSIVVENEDMKPRNVRSVAAIRNLVTKYQAASTR